MIDNGDTDLARFMHRLENRAFGSDVCFLCARSLTQLGSTSEHVIPRWAQRRYYLWDQSITLLNKSSIPYRYLTVPCCEECNKYHLQPIENLVLAASEQGAVAVRGLPKRVLFLWLGKILYGLLYREVLLPFDRSQPEQGSIVSETVLAHYVHHLRLLQEARGKLEAVDFTPGSVFVFNTQIPREPKLQWDFIDDINHLTIGIRIGKVGIVAALADGGAQEMSPIVPQDVFELPLHPLQFREVCATIAYRATTATRTAKHITIEGMPHKTYQLPLMGWSLKPLFEEWNAANYAKYLAFYLDLDYSEVFFPPGNVLTYMVNEDRSFRYMPIEDTSKI